MDSLLLDDDISIKPDRVLRAGTTTLRDFSRVLRSSFIAPMSVAEEEDWQALVEKLRRSAEALLLLNRSIREDYRRAVDAIKSQLSRTLLRCRNDMVKALNQPLQIIPKSLHPV